MNLSFGGQPRRDEDLIKKGGNANYDLKGKSFLFYEPG
jgi:hypothetical protein